jgi:hypothetical protein
MKKKAKAARPPAVAVWLRAAGLGKLATQIAQLEAGWRAARVATRRDWWEVLARGSTIGGVTFPKVAAARARQGLPPDPDALDTPGVVAPPKRPSIRKLRKAAARRAAR